MAVSVEVLTPAFNWNASHSPSIDTILQTCAAGMGVQKHEIELCHIIPVSEDHPISERMGCFVRNSRTAVGTRSL